MWNKRFARIMGTVLELWKLTPTQEAPVLVSAIRDFIQRQDITKTLIILHGCTAWSMPSIIALNEHHLLSELQIFIFEYVDQTLDLLSLFIAAHACLNSQ